ncbi:hypothetical protein BUALT_Bualt14G0027000 [Buddleja alternifolia]|uniref:Retrotransposon gag domain-containing protein n=1 Tax=Buddleja alternifolia TaxID=168488 RepID=A0AAV6WFQ4_9LAMI|nr:hypothetical protein BUALT_Bualt14G0027000 [Buddleja alternifolia]
MTQGLCNQCGMAGRECGLSSTVKKTRQLAGWLDSVLGFSAPCGISRLWAKFSADPNALRDRILEMETRIRRVEGFMGTPMEPLETTVFQALEKKDVLQKSVNEIPFFIEGQIVSMGEDLGILTDAMDLKIDVINTELSVLKRAVGGSMQDERPYSSKLKEAKISDSEKVSITSMYLAGDAKLWWRTHLSDDISTNRQKIETWDALKRELKDQFLPCNTSWLARESLRKLKHTGTVRDYVKDFSSLMLDIREMAEEDKLLNFMSGLQSWAQAELTRQGVKDLPSAYAAADRLVDFLVVGGSNSEKKKSKDGGKDKGKNKYGKDKKSKFKKAKDVVSGSKPKDSQPEIDRS